MITIRTGVRPALGLLVIAHGFAHTLLPSRLLDPVSLSHDAMPLILYGVAVLGFTCAGLGLLGVRPFTAAMRPALVLASAYSLVAIYRMGDGGQYGGAAVDGALLITGLTALYRFLPQPEPHPHGVWHAVGVGTGVSLVLVVAAIAVWWPLSR